MTVFTKSVYLQSIYAGAVRDPLTVIEDFLADLHLATPVFVGENMTRVFVTFRDSGRMAVYSLPLAYKKYIPREVKP